MNTRLLSPLPPPIPDHVLLRRIGAGSYGEVWLAKNVLGAYRAVKIVHRATFPSERPYEREFEGIRNYEPVSRTHPGLVNVLHVGRDALAECFFYVMEVADDLTGKPVSNPDTYVPRTLLAELKKRGRLGAAESATTIAQLAAALAHLHRHGLIHRDIKPANIIFVNGVPKFADIGLVTGLGAKATLVGTEGYLAPEGPGSATADIFSLGKVLYETCLGCDAHDFPDLPAQLREFPDAPLLMRLNRIILKACAPRVEDRYPSADDLQTALVGFKDAPERPAPVCPSPLERNGANRPVPTVVFVCPAAAEPEVALALRLSEKLTAQGCQCSLEQDPAFGTEWARQIEGKIRSASLVVFLLSPTTIHDLQLAYAAELTQQTSRRGSSTQVVGLRVAYAGPLPRFFELVLDSPPPLTWQNAADDERISTALLTTLEINPNRPTL